MTDTKVAQRSSSELAALRKEKGIPEDPTARRDWIRYQLNGKQNPATGRRWSQRDIAKQVGVNEGWVSAVFAGREIKRASHTKSRMVQRVTGELLGVDVDVLFGAPHDGGA